MRSKKVRSEKKCVKYERFGNLTYILPPGIDTSNGVDANELSELAYQYKHDYRNRPFAKKIPGKGWEHIIYNKLDQVVLTQDAKQKTSNEWLFTKYDALGRVAYTGIIEDDRNRSIIQNEINNFTEKLWVSRDVAQMVGGATMYYNDGGYPKVQNGEVLTINYYDDYGFLASEDALFDSPVTVFGQEVDNRTKSLGTGSKVKTLNTGHWTTTVDYYDNKARPIYTVSKNEFLAATYVTENKLSFTGRVEKTRATHTKDGNAAIVTEDVFEYDHMGRATKHSQSINGQEETIAENSYDELGQLESKAVGGGLQKIDYAYNIRGWLKGINDVGNLGDDLWGFKINYNGPQNGATALYNGNISETLWRSANDNLQRHYTYSYDALDRITGAASNDNRYNLNGVTYDKMGNILTLQRNGHLNEAATSFGMMDDLTYTYHNGGNRLKTVVDAIAQPFGFAKRSSAVANEEYSYDLNGNMTKDPNKGITSISYNHLNLPQALTINNNTDNGNIQYVYDATGTKLRKVAADGGNVTTTDYAGSYVYKNGQLEFFDHPEGYIERENDGSYSYIYQFKDHLGNIRLSYSDRDNDGKIDVVRNNVDIDGDSDYAQEIREEKNYYPFGSLQKGYNSLVTGRKHNYGYNGKEEQGEAGLEWLDFGARNYDASIGRWMNIDPLAEDMSRHSPYNYGFDNPVYFVDPDGMAPSDRWQKGEDGSLTWINDDGGDTTDYVDTVDADGNVVSTEEIAVETTTSECSSCEVDNTIKSPGSRWNIKGTGDPRIQEADLGDPFALIADEAMQEAGINPVVVIAVMLILDTEKALKKLGRKGKQKRLKELADDDKLGKADRGWIKSEQNQIKNGKRKNIRNPPGKELAHERGREAAKGYSYEHSNLQDRDLHKRQHKYDDKGKKNKERPVDQ